MHDVLHMVTRYFFSISLIVNSITIQLCGSKLSSTCHMMHHMSLFFFFSLRVYFLWWNFIGINFMIAKFWLKH